MRRVKLLIAGIVFLMTVSGMGTIMPAYCEEIEVEEQFALAGEEELLLPELEDTLMPEAELVDSQSSEQPSETQAPAEQTPTNQTSSEQASAEQSSPEWVHTKLDVTLTAKDKSFKKKTKVKKYTITLKDEFGKAVKKVKVKLRVNGKTYKAKTNKKGKATFKITNLTKKGKYTATVKFAGNDTYKSVKKKVKITVKK